MMKFSILQKHPLTFKKLSLIGLSIFLLCLISFIIFRGYVIHEFEEVLKQQNNNTIFYDMEGRPFHVIQGKEDRKYTPLNQISRNLQKAVLAIEDSRFFYHYGFDPIRLAGVSLRLFIPGAKLQGASTITQQLVKVTLLSPERTFTRKFKELFMAIALESKYSKAQILEYYLNTVYLGHRNYGVENASLNYYHKSASELSLAEGALIAGLIKKPEGYSPYAASTTKTRKRQLLVLRQMKKLGWITAEEYQDSIQERISIKRSKASSLSMAPFFTSHVLVQLKAHFKASQIYGGGLRVYTTLLRKEQKQMEKSIQARAKRPKSFSEMAGLSMDASTGFVGALVGGIDFETSEFNRATQAMRQPGSSIKPILYTAALSSGMRIQDIFQDEPHKYPGSLIAEEANYYEPVNYSNRYLGPITFGSALQNSNNVVSVQILNQIGISTFARMAEKFGIMIPKDRGLCLALGCGEVTLLEMVHAYSTFANDGVIHKPVFIVKVTDERGKILFEYKPSQGERILSSSQAYQMNRLLQNVVQHGTGKAARLDVEAGGKTGTTDSYRDAWFIGFTANKIAGFWVGNDDNSPMEREVGGGTPARIWKSFMVGNGPEENQKSFAMNPDFEDFLVCNGSGKLANSWCLETSWLPLQREHAPTDHCDVHEVAPVERFICKDSKMLAGDFCPTERIASQRYLAGKEPIEYCDVHDAYTGEGEFPTPTVLQDPNATPVRVDAPQKATLP